MASGDTKTNQYLDIAARGTRADLQRGCCNTRTQDLIMDVAERIITEEETRAREDQVLQNEIDEIKNNPDVYDIVATYADLQDYDTSTITDKDVIRVLRDETHDNASTYYRWDAADQEFDYIGETGDYYTKAQVNALLALKADKATTYTKTETDALLDGKQDVLTAGENIAIEDESGSLVISATDTTYSAFTGTDGTAAGADGLVPAPATTDAGKFLSASGLWEAVAGGGGVTELTTADYNYPTDNPTSVALWKLEPGLYTKGTGVTTRSSTNAQVGSAGDIFLVGKADNSNRVGITIFGKSSQTQYSTDKTSGASVTDGKDVFYNNMIEQSTGTATTTVMSQNATTSMVFDDPSAQTTIKIGATAAHKINLGVGAHTYSYGGIAIGSNSNAPENGSVALGFGANASKKGAVAIGPFASAATVGQVDFGVGISGQTSYGYDSSQYRLLTGLYDPQSAHDAATKGYVDGTTETYTIATADWSALSSSSPYTYQATVTATYTIGANTIAELLNDSPVDFATHGFAIGSISGQSVTIYSIGEPSASVPLKVNYKG